MRALSFLDHRHSSLRIGILRCSNLFTICDSLLQLGVSPAECLYIGDAESDMRAADAAGMLPLAVRFGYIAEDDKPQEWPAHAWLDSPLQVLDWVRR